MNMSDKKNNGIGLRSFVSVLLMFSSGILVLTGIILFITPPGRVAHWTGWRMLGLNKEQWGAVHICFSICVIIASILHIYLNFKPLMNYFKNRVTKKFSFRIDWFAAAILCVAIFAGAVAAIPPFSSIMTINKDIKFSWEKPTEKAPIPHAETLTLADLAKKADLDLDSMIANLKKAEMGPAKPETVLKQLAKKYKMTPMQVFKVATGEIFSKPGKPVSEPAACDGQKRGLGKKTLKQFCEEENIDITAAIEKLKASGIEASENDNLKVLADKALTNPSAIAKIATSSEK
jgi:hypothetical protein